nr:hypothetical protein [Tanacetum cinerariifolium]
LIGNALKLLYTTNPGMAFGVELPPPYGKLLLTGFRLLAVGGLSYYITHLWRERAPKGFIACMALILGGAVGNLIDSIFYGVALILLLQSRFFKEQEKPRSMAPETMLLLTAFRLAAVSGLSYYIVHLWRHRAASGFIACMALILGGAVGNLIDSIFYGIIYNNAPVGSPSRWFFGQVIDMLYADIYEGFLPASWPLVGGKYVSLWPIFNVADSSIFIGVALILLFQGKFFKQEEPAAPRPASTPASPPASETA